MRRIAQIVFAVAVSFLCSIPSVAQTPTPTPRSADVDGNGHIDSEDLILFLQSWRETSIAASTSTPTETPGFTDTETPTATETPSNTLTATDTPSFTPTETPTGEFIEIPLPNLPPGARPLRLVRIPATGQSFEMGSPETERGRGSDEGPVHTVTFNYDFYMGETEVTQGQWQAVMNNNPATGSGVGPDYPVYSVSWNGCQSFITALNALGQGTFRLPTEAEWEYACRAGTSARFYFGDSLGCIDTNVDCAAGTLSGNRSDYMWYAFNLDTPTTGSKPVHGKLANAFGLYDMHGNTWEWCQDWYHLSFTGAPNDGSAWESPTGNSRVMRGGSWGYDARNCRSAVRSGVIPNDANIFIGSRLVRLP